MAALFVLLMLVSLGRAADGRFQRFDFTVAGRVTNVFTEDMDMDGLLDLVCVHADESKDPPGRYLTIYPQLRDQGFDSKVKIEYTFPPNVAAVDAGDVAATPGRELVFITEKGVYYASIADNRVGPLREIFKVQSVVAIAYNRDVPYYNFVRDYTGDGKDDIFVSGFYDVNREWVYFYQRTDRTFNPEPDRVTSTGLKFDLSKLRFESGLPNIVGDFNGDGYYDQVFGDDENTLLISLLDQNGNKTGVEERVEMPVSLINRTVDLNHDGKSDILVLNMDEQSEYPNVFRVLLNVGPWD